MFRALEHPKVAPVQVWGCTRARDIFGTRRPSPIKTTCSFSDRFRGNPGIRVRAGKNNKLNFLWPKMACLGPPF